jgi:hypothetical protein
MTDMPTISQRDTESEKLFAAYLDREGHVWDRHPEFPGRRKKPDFSFMHNGVQVLCEVKQREANERQKAELQAYMDALLADEDSPSRARNFNPVKNASHLIKGGIETFKEFDNHLCALVVFDAGNPDTRLNPTTIYGTILGNPGFTAQLQTDTGVIDVRSVRATFIEWEGEEERRYRALENISAVIVLDLYSLPNPVFEEAFEQEAVRQSAENGRLLTDDEQLAIRYGLLKAGMRMFLEPKPGVTVCVTPDAKPFPKDLFMGPMDERWEVIEGMPTRVFIGEERLALESLDNEGDGFDV